MKCPLRPTNKQFLVNTILPTLSTNKNRYYVARRNYYRLDDETYSRGYSPDDRYPSGDRHSYRPRRESDSEGRSSHSHRNSKGNSERRDKNKDSSPARRRKLSNSGSLNNKESENSNGTENKTADSRNIADGHKEHSHHRSSKDKYHGEASHKSHRIDRLTHRKTENSHHHKKHDDHVSADKQCKDNEKKDHKTEVEEKHTKSRFDMNYETKDSVKIGLDSCKDEKQTDTSRAFDSNSNYKHGEDAAKHDKAKDLQANNTEHESVQHFKKDGSACKNISTVSENDSSNSKTGKHKKKISGDIDNCEGIKKRKKSRKRKKDKSKKVEGMHSSNAKKIKKKRHRTLTAECEKSEVPCEGSIAKVRRTENKSESVKYDERNDEESKWNTEDKSKVLQQCRREVSGKIGQEVTQLKDHKYSFQKSEANQTVSNDLKTKENAKVEELNKKIVRSSSTEEDNKNCSKNKNSVGKVEKLKKNEQTFSESKESSYVNTSDKSKEGTEELNNLSMYNKNSTCSKKDNARNCYSSEKHASKDFCHTNSRSSKDTANSRVHHRGKSGCLRDITDEMYHGAKNSKRSKRKRWSIESD